MNIWPAVERDSGPDLLQGLGRGSAVGKWDVLAYRDVLQWRAEACAEAGFAIQATVWAIAADMCRAAAWASQYGAFEAERRVRRHCRDE
jgi:hypothetical protein